MSLTFLDFFSGIGGFRLGMEQAGHTCLGHCEIDKFANISYTAIHQPKEGEWFATDIRGVTPEELPAADCYCFGFPCQSFSIAGERGGFEDTRGTLFFEVMRLARVRKPKYLLAENVAGLLSHDGGKTFGTILNTLGELGYWYEYQVLNSKNFGVPHNRERVFIVGHLGEISGQKVFPITKRLGIDSRKKAADFRYDEGLRIRWDGTTPCLMASHTLCNISKSVILVDEKRYLTSKEHFRLQGFNDEYYERAAQVNEERQLYKQAGNSVTVNVVYEIARRLV